MPNRIIRESALTSHTLAQLSDGAERLFWRLTVVADDHGRFDAYPSTVKARCFPTLVDSITTKRVCGWRDELAARQIIGLYGVGERVYGWFVNWAKYQRGYGLASKFPDPPAHTSIPSEKSIHDLLYSQLLESKEFCGYQLTGVDRNVRAGSGYADFVLLTTAGRIVVELKRTRADKGAIGQVMRYRSAIRDAVTAVVIATGLGAGFAISHALSVDVAVIEYDQHGKTLIPIKNKHITQCDDLLIPVNACEFAMRSYPISENRESRSENRESRSEIRESRSVDQGSTEASEFEQLWRSYPRKVGKDAARKAWMKLIDARPALTVILLAIEKQTLSEQWQEPRFIPHLSTWLTGKRWTDELAPHATRHIAKSMVELL